MSDVTDLMLSRFAVLYGEPKTGDLEAFFGEYERALNGTSRDILEAATNRVIKAQEFRSWPTPGECVKACHVEAEKLAKFHKPESAADLDRKPWPAPTEESKRRVRELVQAMKHGITIAQNANLTETSRRMTGEQD